MNDRLPSGPPGGPLQRDPQSAPAQGSGRSKRGVLTHAAVGLVGLLVGGLIGSAVGGDSGGDAARPAETVTATATTGPVTGAESAASDSTGAGPADEFSGDGTFVVGKDIVAGTYNSAGPQGGLVSYCSWERLSGTSGEVGDIIAANATKGRTTVTIASTDKAFTTTGCKSWQKVG
ncbi:hypothetical protein [Streptomyces sp. NBC_00038]|uniref:hypothetical protein n=1 Tax=Streptomyces sp. NBC_00038 TaxID=2903615 RepID=UPI0022578E86|nr:hypothetical protein [Streptomyces sp. NBC_00038]MCX5558254.1 hypothetical protein [Streptomyces sp. NBC_00038]